MIVLDPDPPCEGAVLNFLLAVFEARKLNKDFNPRC